MLIMSVAISCCRVIAGSRSLSLRMLGAAEDGGTGPSDSDERQKDSTCLRPPQINITVSSSSPPPFNLSISLYPGLLTLIAASFLYDWEIYNPISTAPCLWLGPARTNTYTLKKHRHLHLLTQTRVCAITHQVDVSLSAFLALCTCHFM